MIINIFFATGFSFEKFFTNLFILNSKFLKNCDIFPFIKEGGFGGEGGRGEHYFY